MNHLSTNFYLVEIDIIVSQYHRDSIKLKNIIMHFSTLGFLQ